MASNALRIPFSSLKTHNGQSIKEKSRIKREFYRKAEKVVLVFSNLQIGHKYVKRVVEWDDDVYEKQEEETKVESSGCVDGDGEIVDVEMNVERKTFITPSPSSPSKSPFKVLHSPATTVTSTITNSSVIPLPPNPVNAGSSANSVSAATAAAAAIAMKLGSVQVSQYLQHQQPVIFPHHPKPVPVNTGIPPQVQQKYQPKQKIPIPTRPTPIQPPTIPPPPPMMMNIPPVPKLVSHDHDLVPPGTSVPDTNVGSVTPISEVGSKQEQYVPSQGQQIQQQQDQPVQQVQKVHPLPDHPNKKGHYAPFNNHTNSHQHNQQMNHMNHNQHVKRSENRYPNQTWYANGVSASGGGGGGGPIRGNKRIGQANFHTVNGSGQHGSSGHGSVGYQGMGTFGNHGNHGMTGISTGQVFSGQFSGVPNNPNLVTQQQQFQQQGVTRVPPNAMNSVNTMNPMFMRPVFPGGGGGVGATTTGVSNGGMGGQFGYQTGPGFAMGSGYSRVYGEDGKQVNGWMSYGQ
ncbi:hypothetical protein HK098_000752 [Nowakowskiella sp. JEL0407]|nr:hypothetical protein HK098_000752 [Nowakowskiella sp. JEL0407]